MLVMVKVQQHEFQHDTSRAMYLVAAAHDNTALLPEVPEMAKSSFAQINIHMAFTYSSVCQFL